jgi:hypothetical protein
MANVCVLYNSYNKGRYFHYRDIVFLFSETATEFFIPLYIKFKFRIGDDVTVRAVEVVFHILFLSVTEAAVCVLLPDV